jgi:hypothetical protein
MLPGDPLWTGDPTPMGLKNVRLHNQNNSAAVRFQRVALAGEDQAAHPGQTGDAAGGLLADKREVAVDDEQRGRRSPSHIAFSLRLGTDLNSEHFGY